jgi:hypothetical protein
MLRFATLHLGLDTGQQLVERGLDRLRLDPSSTSPLLQRFAVEVLLLGISYA